MDCCPVGKGSGWFHLSRDSESFVCYFFLFFHQFVIIKANILYLIGLVLHMLKLTFYLTMSYLIIVADWNYFALNVGDFWPFSLHLEHLKSVLKKL